MSNKKNDNFDKGYVDGLKEKKPKSDDSDYLKGHNAGNTNYLDPNKQK